MSIETYKRTWFLVMILMVASVLFVAANPPNTLYWEVWSAVGLLSFVAMGALALIQYWNTKNQVSGFDDEE